MREVINGSLDDVLFVVYEAQSLHLLLCLCFSLCYCLFLSLLLLKSCVMRFMLLLLLLLQVLSLYSSLDLDSLAILGWSLDVGFERRYDPLSCESEVLRD